MEIERTNEYINIKMCFSSFLKFLKCDSVVLYFQTCEHQRLCVSINSAPLHLLSVNTEINLFKVYLTAHFVFENIVENVI